MKKNNTIVIAYNGKELERTKCRYINGKFYEVNVDCFKVEGNDKWQRIDNGRIAYNYTLNRYDLIDFLENNDYIKGIVDDSGELKYFKTNYFKNVFLAESYPSKTSNITVCLNKELALKLDYIEFISDGIFYKKRNLTSTALKKANVKNIGRYNNKKINYNANISSSTFLNTLQSYRDKENIIDINERTRIASKILGDYSFGIEFETSDGFVPSNICDKLGLVPLKDGSLRHDGKEPYEYTTVPLSGERGLETLKLICEELTKRCDFNTQCSNHIHIGVGELGRDKHFLLALYILIYEIQGDLFNFFPEYKKNPMKHLSVEKNYCKALTSLGLNVNTIYDQTTEKEIVTKVNHYFDKLFAFLCDNQVSGITAKYNLDNFIHPQGDTKWNRLARYHHVNLINTVFSSTRTVEYRLHTPGFNFIKISNWLFICTAIIKYAKAYQKQIISREIKDISLTTVLNGYSNFFGELNSIDTTSKEVAEYLIDYVNYKTNVVKNATLNKDYFCKEIEFENDMNFKFSNGTLDSIY